MRLKKLLLLGLILAISFSINAETLDTIISSAKENSPSYKNAGIVYQNGLLGLKQLDKEDKTIISIGGSITPIARGGTLSLFSDENVLSFTPNVSVTSSDKKTTLSSSLGYSMDYNNTVRVYSPTLDVSHTFDLSGFDSDTLKDLRYSISKLTTEMTYWVAEYQFEQTVINTIISLLSSLKTLEATDKSINDLKTQLDNINKLETVSKDSITYKNIVNSITALENTRVALEQQYEDAKINYKIFSGLDWDGIEDIPEPILNLNILPNGNTSVIISSLNVQVAEEEYKSLKATQEPKGITISGGASGSYIDKTTNTGTLGINGAISYIADNWTISASHSSSWDFSNSSTSYTPSLTLSGAWTNGSLTSTSRASDSIRDELELQKKQNLIVSANNDYISALTSYTQKAQSLSVDIIKWNFSLTEIKTKISYLKDVCNNKKTLFESGLATQLDVDNAEFDLKQAEYEEMIVFLNGLSLERDLRIFAL